MRAQDIAVEQATVRSTDSVATALRLMADHGLPGVIMVGEDDKPIRVIPGSQVLRMAVPDEFQHDPALVRAIDEAHADSFWDQEQGLPIEQCLDEKKSKLGVVTGDATLLEVATMMAKLHSPLLGVVDRKGRLTGTVTLPALLKHLSLPTPG